MRAALPPRLFAFRRAMWEAMLKLPLPTMVPELTQTSMILRFGAVFASIRPHREAVLACRLPPKQPKPTGARFALRMPAPGYGLLWPFRSNGRGTANQYPCLARKAAAD